MYGAMLAFWRENEINWKFPFFLVLSIHQFFPPSPTLQEKLIHALFSRESGVNSF